MNAPSIHDLLQPLNHEGLELQNRVVLAPMTRGRAGKERLANRTMAEYYAQRASAGLILTEATTVSAQGNGWVDSPGIYTEQQGTAWKQVTEAVHQAAGKIFLQLWHTGRASHSSFHEGELPVAPSAVRLEGDELHTPTGKHEYEVPRALKASELPGIVTDYENAARRALKAGFDGIEVHAANGYLLDQFLQSKTNLRQDEYGGSAENRFRLLSEVLQSVTQIFPANRVGVRLSPNGVFNDMGSPDFRETFMFVAGQLDDLGLAYLHVMDGLAFGFHEQGKPMTLTEFRDVFHGPLMANCGYDMKAAETALSEGQADLISIGRPFIANPDLLARWTHGWPLAESDMDTWYKGDPITKGYTDYPNFK